MGETFMGETFMGETVIKLASSKDQSALEVKIFFFEKFSFWWKVKEFKKNWEKLEFLMGLNSKG